MLECVVNVSEGRDADLIAALAEAGGADLLDVHSDPHHNRTVLTLVGEAAPRAVTTAAIERIDLRTHDGVHPRIGAVDVVPFVPLTDSSFDDAVHARDAFAKWLADTHAVPSFLYGTGRTLPEIRRDAFTSLTPDYGPPTPHPSAGAVAVGARPLLVAYNVWLAKNDLALARQIAGAIRGPVLRTLGLQVGDQVQVSMNLIAPDDVGPAEAYDAVAALASVDGAELVGLLPAAVLERVDSGRWEQLDLSEDRTIEARLAARATRDS